MEKIKTFKVDRNYYSDEQNNLFRILKRNGKDLQVARISLDNILDKFYTLGEVNDYTHCQGSYVFCVNETVRSYSLKEKADW